MSDAVARLNAALEGRYRIESELGEGGMATVYLADDLKHNRKVALKVLKPELAAVVGAERFLAEIETTANLTHPHILPLFDSGEADSFLFYVMPHIEGESLRERIDREKQLPVDEAVKIATDLAEALDYAHRHGIIHRDIKPANILLHEGRPLIADFGIALAVGVAGGGRLTETGLSVGTPHYMSPEQATGDQAVGGATDIYALGAVLYEMLIGEPPYTGSTAQAILGKIIQGKLASATEERASVPANVDAAIRKALEKLPADRFTGAQEFAGALADPGFRHGELDEAAVVAGVGPWKRLTMATTTLAALFAVTLAWSLSRPDPPRPVLRVSINIPEDQFSGSFDLSSDGSLMVYQGVGDDGQPQLWVKRWDALDGTPIRGTDGAEWPAVSPDEQEVAFYLGLGSGSLRVVPLQGGVSKMLAEGLTFAPRWSPDGAWVYYTDPTVGLLRVAAGGGQPEVITRPDTAALGENEYWFVDVLPGGRGAVFMANGLGGFRIQAVDLETREVKDLTPGTFPRYSPTGHLLFIDEDGTLLAAAFDVERLELTGDPVPLASGLTVLSYGEGFFALSQTGRLVYRTGASGGIVTPVWVERDGTAREIVPGWTEVANGTFASLALSPDGDRLAIIIPDGEGGYDLWVKQLPTGPLSRLTFGRAGNRRPTWSPDGQSLTFVSHRGEQQNLWTTRADGTGTAELVLDRELRIFKGLYSPDGTWLVFSEGTPLNATLSDIYAIRPGVDSAVVPLLMTEFNERSPALSPDGRWLSYVSNDTGRDELYVRPFPDAGSALVQVSTDGGRDPLWAHSGRELFYVNGANDLVAVQVTGDPTFTPGQQDVLFSMADYLTGDARYDVSPDDQRFVMLGFVDEGADDAELILVENWAEELRERAGSN